jgi:hypothetical protein
MHVYCVFLSFLDPHTTGRETDRQAERQTEGLGDRQVLGAVLKQQAQGGGRLSEDTQKTF